MAKRLRTAQVVQRDDDRTQESVLFHDGATGEIIKEIPLGPAKRFSHGKIRALLAEGIPVQVSTSIPTIQTPLVPPAETKNQLDAVVRENHAVNQ